MDHSKCSMGKLVKCVTVSEIRTLLKPKLSIKKYVKWPFLRSWKRKGPSRHKTKGETIIEKRLGYIWV